MPRTALWKLRMGRRKNVVKVPLQHRLSEEMRDFPEASQGHVQNPAIELASLSLLPPVSQPEAQPVSLNHRPFPHRNPSSTLKSEVPHLMCISLLGLLSRSTTHCLASAADTCHRTDLEARRPKPRCPQGCASCRHQGGVAPGLCPTAV